METKIFKDTEIDAVVDLLKSAQVVALPTETVYGLAADAANEQAIKKIFSAKSRPMDHPLIVHIAQAKDMSNWALHIPSHAYKLAAHFWPGPLTMLFHKKPEVSNVITGGLSTVALRVPGHQVMLNVISRLGNAIVAPSANAHKKISPTKLEHVLKTLGGKIAGVVEGGTCAVGIESTIVDMTKDRPVILRPGAITAEMIEQVLDCKVEVPISHVQKVSGNMLVHYQPEKPLFLLSAHQIQERLPYERNVAVIYYSDIPHSKYASWYRMPQDKHLYAKELYDILHRVDSTDVEKIFVEYPPVSPEWSDVHDRLMKASFKG